MWFSIIARLRRRNPSRLRVVEDVQDGDLDHLDIPDVLDYLSTMAFAARVIALTILLFICYAIAGTLVRLAPPPQPTAEAASSTGSLLAVCFLNAAVVAYVIHRARWAGWRLVATIFLVFYGVTTFMGQIESAVFITRLPPGALPRLFLMGALVAAPFSALAVLAMGKRRASTSDAGPNARLHLPASEWAWKLAVIALVYVILYFTFGYFVAWRHPEVRAYYNGVDAGGFMAHMAMVVRDTPWLIPFQIVRALLWTALALPVIRMMKGGRLETALAVGLLFGVVMNAQLLLPNPYMPEVVRMAHLAETASSNFLFGAFIAWLLTKRHTADGSAARPEPIHRRDVDRAAI